MFQPGLGLCGAAAGAVNGLLGAGGGMVLVPLLQKSGHLEQGEVFPSSVAVMLPLCVVSIVTTALREPLPWGPAAPYLLGSIPGGVLAGLFGRRIGVLWLHRVLGLVILWGGVRYLW